MDLGDFTLNKNKMIKKVFSEDSKYIVPALKLFIVNNCKISIFNKIIIE